MPIIRDQIANRIQTLPGWDGATVRVNGTEERHMILDKNDGANTRMLISRPRRIYHNTGSELRAIDTDWISAAGLDQFKIEVGDYTLLAGGRGSMAFFNDKLIRYFVGAVELFALTPSRNLFWENDRGQTRSAGAAVNVTGTRDATDPNKIVWNDAYGAGIDYELDADSDSVAIQVRAERLNRLGAFAAGDFFFKRHKIDMELTTRVFYTNDAGQVVEWDKAATVETNHPIVFRDAAGGFRHRLKTPWVRSSRANIGPTNRRVIAGQAFDQNQNPTILYSWYRLSEDSGDLFIDACFNPEPLPTDSVLWFDPSLNVSVVDSLTAEHNTYGGGINTTKGGVDCAIYASGGVYWYSNWDISSLDGDETIDTAVIDIHVGSVAAGCDIDVRIEDTRDSTFPTTDGEGNTRRTNWHGTTTNWGAPTASSRQDTVDFASLLETVLSGNVGSVGEAAIDFDPSPGTNTDIAFLYNGSAYAASYDPELQITYTEPAGGAVKDIIGGMGIIPSPR